MSNKFYTESEERANTLSHGLGILLGIAGGYILLLAAFKTGSNRAIISVIAYLIGMQASYISSTLYHRCTHDKRKQALRKCDHAAIYLHIAGTYMPFALWVLREQGAWGWILFTYISLAAICGVILSFRKLKDHSHLETICFVLMGCSVFIVIRPLYNTLLQAEQVNALYWLMAGGAAYITGALFYSWTKRVYMHTVFHIFVLMGSVCHIAAIYIIM